MGGCQNYGPLWGPLKNTRRRIIFRTQRQKGAIFLTTTHMGSLALMTQASRNCGSVIYLGCYRISSINSMSCLPSRKGLKPDRNSSSKGSRPLPEMELGLSIPRGRGLHP